MFKNILIITLLIIASCKNSSKQKVIQNKAISHKFPLILDTISKYRILPFTSQYIEDMQMAEYYLYYIGKYEDTIYLHTLISYLEPPPSPKFFLKGEKNKFEFIETKLGKTKFSEYTIEESTRYKNSDSNKLEIIVDTSKIISNYYCALIVNNNKDTIIISHGDYINAVLEAKDSIGNWKPIQVRHWYGCGYGLKHIFLPPNECAITLVPIFRGKYKRELRLKMGINYSNIFYGYIFNNQFVKNYP